MFVILRTSMKVKTWWMFSLMIQEKDRTSSRKKSQKCSKTWQIWNWKRLLKNMENQLSQIATKKIGDSSIKYPQFRWVLVALYYSKKGVISLRSTLCQFFCLVQSAAQCSTKPGTLQQIFAAERKFLAVLRRNLCSRKIHCTAPQKIFTAEASVVLAQWNCFLI